MSIVGSSGLGEATLESFHTPEGISWAKKVGQKKSFP